MTLIKNRQLAQATIKFNASFDITYIFKFIF